MNASPRTLADLFPSRSRPLIEKAAALLLLTYPGAMLLVHGGMNGAFLLMLLLALDARILGANLPALQWRREWSLYTAAMVGLSLSILLSQLWHGKFASHPHDAASRFWLAIPVFLLLQRMRPGIFGVLELGFPVGAVLGLLLSHDSHVDVTAVRLTVANLDPIHFGDFELMLGALSLASLNWFGRDPAALRVLKLAGFGAGVAASFASGSRGGWLAIPVFAVLPFAFRLFRPSIRLVAAGLAAALLGGALLYAFSTGFRDRMQRLPAELATYQAGNRDTATGMRLQLYAAAGDLFLQHPAFGVGPQGFAEEMQPLMEAGKLTPLAAQHGQGEVHNDILAKTVGMGVPGLLSILALYAIPLWLFWRARKAPLKEVRQAGMLGAMFVSGFLVFGLTVETLNLVMATAFYAFTVAVLLAACQNAYYKRETGAAA